MKRTHINTKNIKTQEVYDSWGDLYDEISSDWRQKSLRMQLRRWHKLRHQQRQTAS